MITVENVNFSYNREPFITNINFNVSEGEVFGFLGPSGAGKSTLQKILTGLIGTYEGSAKINGVEAKKHDSNFYENIGVDFEFPSLYEKLTAKENLSFFSGLYKNHRDTNELLDRMGLLSQADKRVSDYSKGMKSRLNFIKALVHDPQVLFLDEPTSGLDPSNSRIMKEIILEEKSRGKTIIITTHNMVDATELCDEVAFIIGGKMKAKDSPHNLIMAEGATKIMYSYENSLGKEETGECKLKESSEDNKLKELISGNKILSIHSSEPTLDDIFRKITGCELECTECIN